jgi:thiosulfate reductase cytochrome b subunit
MWLLALNGLAYLAYGIVSGHLRRRMLPIAPRALLADLLGALRGRLDHGDLSVYNAAQKAAYLGAILLAVGLVLSGLAIWKPVQLHWLAALMGDYEGARLVHFFCMAGIVLFVLVHVAMVILVPKTFLTMITGKLKQEPQHG